MHTYFDIVIVGAGPAGNSCALALQNSGLQVALIDKAVFPRNKTCGDAIPGAAFKTLQKILPNAMQDWQIFAAKQTIAKSEVITAKGKRIAVEWSMQAYNSTRMSWDNFLMQLVKKQTDTIVLEGQAIQDISPNNETVELNLQDGRKIICKLIIGCDGAYSVVKKHLFTSTEMHKPAVAVRAYYKNLQVAADTNYFFTNNKIAKSYLWIFPVENQMLNVGFGIIPSAANQKVDVKKAFADLLATDKNIKHLFANQQPITKVEGFKLPLFTTPQKISKANCMLCGDAANLIDPIQGHGIDKAMESGRLAAIQAIQCFQQNNFSAEFMQQYDKSIYQSIGKELQRNVKILKALSSFPWLLDALARLSSINWIKNQLKKLT